MSRPKDYPKMRRFWFHYNKPESKRQGRSVLTLHWDNTCHPIHHIKCDMPIESHNRKQQPHCVIRGWCNTVIFENMGDECFAFVI